MYNNMYIFLEDYEINMKSNSLVTCIHINSSYLETG